jgi:hypothetical protein
LHNISLLAAEMTNLVVEYFELVRCCGLAILLDDCTHAVISNPGVQYVSHFKESFVRGVLDQYTVELRLQPTFKEVEIQYVQLTRFEDEVKVFVSLIVDLVLSVCSSMLIENSLNDLNTLIIIEE